MANEKRLIDVNKVIDSMQKCLDESTDKKDSIAYFAFESIIECLKQVPAVDAVEVVRCRDCKHWDSETWFCDNHSTFWHHGLDWNMFSEDDFCSYGERKEGAN